MRIVLLSLVVTLSIYLFLRWLWKTEGFEENLTINKSTMTSKYGQFGTLVPRSEQYLAQGITFPPIEVQKICTTLGVSWGIPFLFRPPGGIYGFRVYTQSVCKYILGGNYVEWTDDEKKNIKAAYGKDIPYGYGRCLVDVQAGSEFNNQLWKNYELLHGCIYLNYTDPGF